MMSKKQTANNWLQGVIWLQLEQGQVFKPCPGLMNRERPLLNKDTEMWSSGSSTQCSPDLHCTEGCGCLSRGPVCPIWGLHQGCKPRGEGKAVSSHEGSKPWGWQEHHRLCQGQGREQQQQQRGHGLAPALAQELALNPHNCCSSQPYLCLWDCGGLVCFSLYSL